MEQNTEKTNAHVDPSVKLCETTRTTTRKPLRITQDTTQPNFGMIELASRVNQVDSYHRQS